MVEISRNQTSHLVEISKYINDELPPWFTHIFCQANLIALNKHAPTTNSPTDVRPIGVTETLRKLAHSALIQEFSSDIIDVARWRIWIAGYRLPLRAQAKGLCAQ